MITDLYRLGLSRMNILVYFPIMIMRLFRKRILQAFLLIMVSRLLFLPDDGTIIWM